MLSLKSRMFFISFHTKSSLVFKDQINSIINE